MGRVIITWTDPSPGGRSATAWAEREAALRRLPLKVAQGPPPSDQADGEAELIVAGLDRSPRLPAPGTTPVVFVPWAPRRLPDTVTVGLDARDPDGGVLRFAFEAARLRGVRLHAVHAWALPARAAARSPLPVLEEDRAEWEDQEVQLLSDALRPWRGKYPDVDVLEDVLLFEPSDALIHAAESSGLLVLGLHTGDTAQDVLEAAVRCPVAVVPS
ncbi:universal stress protein [Streptomyces sp. NBC_00201]|uniref:universal stress protein n=1 Tax=unclassified Streptomyces TaxID=2593676 RepID=UPI0022539A84|nr:MULTISPECIES: universal stress protein [unclassified Streptomyces]MCX5052213.1 universal stress protein [Streptomyces sp. NBC_00474]MCX5063959.1 universal stress protein [Streptomyces sp. NBC_00452]MCX5251383.1 universal stress protein [Streptomyces sp. NBC_00201]MCX5294693.1 universal stress protein [Streptomyces sp. NBC_00183]